MQRQRAHVAGRKLLLPRSLASKLSVASAHVSRALSEIARALAQPPVPIQKEIVAEQPAGDCGEQLAGDVRCA